MAVPRIPERVLRSIWQRRLYSHSLLTSDGDRVMVRFPGVMNPDGGPDFTGALIRIGQVLYRGDVELHIRASAWRAHRHCADPHYNRVILHVVLLPGGTSPPPRTASGRIVPLLVLSPFVDPRLYDRRMNEFRCDPVPLAQCRGKDCILPLRLLRRRLHVLGRRRIERRVRALGKRLGWLTEEFGAGSGEPDRQEGTLHSGAWEQLLYECVLEGMGFAKNRSPFLALARSVSLPLLKVHGLGDARTMQALLFGAAGLLPSMHTVWDKESRAYVRTLRRRWRVLRPGLRVPLLHEGDWMFFRMRPVNFPTARLAMFCFLLPSLFAGHPLERILGIIRQSGTTPRARRSRLVSMFRFSPDRFWSRHIHFRGTGKNGGVALGHARVQELIVNEIVPLLLLYAREYPDRGLGRESIALLRSLPSATENSVTRLVRGALLGGKARPGGSLEHQGILHLYSSYCSRGRCGRCPVRTGRALMPNSAACGVRMSRRCLR